LPGSNERIKGGRGFSFGYVQQALVNGSLLDSAKDSRGFFLKFFKKTTETNISNLLKIWVFQETLPPEVRPQAVRARFMGLETISMPPQKPEGMGGRNDCH
jgi:hypothetical protein